MTAERNVDRRPRFLKIVLWVAGAILVVLFAAGVANLVAPRAVQRVMVGVPTPSPVPTPTQPRAAIVDQTGLSFPTPEFLEQAESYLQQGGYVVDRYEPDAVTVSFLRMLPTKGYSLILFQTHATSEVVVEDGATSNAAPGPFLFTTEPYQEQRYLRLQLEDQVRASKLFYEDSPELFAVGPKFVRRSMRGRFPGTLVVIGGCQSLAAPDLAEAFLEKGASAVVGWDEMVNLSHNNQAVLALLEALTVQGLPLEEGVSSAMAVAGPDPSYQSSLQLLRAGGGS